MLLKTLKQSTSRLLLPFLMATALITGCGETTTSGEDELQSKLYVSLTDAAGDLTQYTVDVTALKLYRANGAIIETLPNTTTLDFARYIDVTEFLSTATVPVGYYSKAEITLDYTNANLSVENDAGVSIPASAIDDNGSPLQSVTLSTLINSGAGFVIRKGQPASLSIDFDLEASNDVEIDPTGNSAIVTVNPILLANTSIDDDKTRRVRGLLADVNTPEETFDVDIRPFRIRDRSHGVITVHTGEQTVYEINGTGYGADIGLTELDKLSELTPMVVLGTFNHDQRRYLAAEVYAGSSVPWGDKDALKGSIIARTDNTLTVLGATIEWDDGHFQFNDEVRVQLGDNTHVTKQGTTEAVGIDDLSVGQRVLILGHMTDENNMDANTAADIVRMRYSDVTGKVTTVSPLELDLQHINRRNVSRYNFDGSGINPANDADPDHYEIDHGTLTLDTLESDSPVWVRGFPTPFGSAPSDFRAKTIIDVSNLPTKIFMSYGKEGSASAVATLDENGLLLNLESATGRHHLKQAGIITDINDLASVPWILPADGRALYAISQARTVDVFTRWENFQRALAELLEKGHRLVFVHSRGQYDPSELTLTSRHLVVRVTE